VSCGLVKLGSSDRACVLGGGWGALTAQVVAVRTVSSASSQGIDSPLSWHPAQLRCSAIFELQVGAYDELLYGARDKHFAFLRQAGHPRPDVDRDAAYVSFEDLALAGV